MTHSNYVDYIANVVKDLGCEAHSNMPEMILGSNKLIVHMFSK